ncbi:olfactory receptor 10A3-like [Engystomops pustulosus]|uniref:olfactory receptor 10A3-like n=1 Tax=Engystomops pustulosus TaxID=76066 RepID=UPI003AFA4DF6
MDFKHQKLSCSDTSVVELRVFLFSVPLFIFPCGFIIVTYVYIFSTIAKIPSTMGHRGSAEFDFPFDPSPYLSTAYSAGRKPNSVELPCPVKMEPARGRRRTQKQWRSLSTMNQTRLIEFILLGFGNLHSFGILLFILFLIIFLITVIGNLLIIILFSTNVQLQSPMYYFLCHLSVSDLVISSTIVPNMLVAILLGRQLITFVGCITQLYFYSVTIDTECFLLSVMSYDRYLAICNPLRYHVIMDFNQQINLSLWPWILSLTLGIVGVLPISNFNYCHENIIDSFYCEVFPLQQLSCSDTSLTELEALVFSVPLFILPCGFIIVTYVYIFHTIAKIPSTTGKHKAFSTCSSHLIVVGTFFGTLIVKYMIPSKGASILMNKIISSLHTVFTPLFNPIIYSLRNQDIKMALQKFLANNRNFN